MPSQLLFMNIPYNCSDGEFKEWIESRGVEVESIRIIRDLVAGVSPAFAYANVRGDAQIQEVASVLNGKKIRNHVVTVKPIAERSVFPNASSVFTVRWQP